MWNRRWKEFLTKYSRSCGKSRAPKSSEMTTVINKTEQPKILLVDDSGGGSSSNLWKQAKEFGRSGRALCPNP
jgi:hypothetical protein